MDRLTELLEPLIDADDLHKTLAALSEGSRGLEDGSTTIAEQFAHLERAGVLRWGIPEEYGGVELTSQQQVVMYDVLASACLITTFVLSQRNAAITRIIASKNEAARMAWLPKLAANEVMATVGISHLTTSRQHLRKPAVQAREIAGGFELNGEIPWVTGASLTDILLTGGTLDDGRQVLTIIETSANEVTVTAPPALLALEPSATSTVVVHDLFVPESEIIAGPVEGVMKSLSGGTGSVTTSALANGMARGVLRGFEAEADKRSELFDILNPMRAEQAQLTEDLLAFTDASCQISESLSSESLRSRANSLVLRAAQAYLAASKGAGFVKGHPAERAVRESMFFLVWSCPQPVVQSALRQFACLDGF